MSDYIDETPLTDEEIAAAIAAARKAKAERVKEEKKKAPKTDLTKKPEPEDNGKDTDGEESSEDLFSEIDSAADDENQLSPKMKSAKSFSNAFAAARIKREENLRKKQAEKEAAVQKEQNDEQENEQENEEDVVFAQEFDVDSEDIEFENSDIGEDAERLDDSVSDEVSEFDADEEDEYYTADGEESEQVEFDGIFQPDGEEVSGFGERTPIDSIEADDDDEYDDDEDDDGDSAVSTRTKVIVGIIIGVLILAIIGVGAYFALNGGNGGDTSSVVSNEETDVKALKFSESSISLRVGETAPLNIIVEPEDAKDKVLKLKSGDTSIATVDSTGIVTGVSSGSTTVTATLKSNETITASIVINVIDEDQNAINMYNNFINSIVEGTTDIDSDDTDTDTEEETDTDTENSSDSDSDTDSDDSSAEPKSVLTGSIIRDLNDDGNLELALYYTSQEQGSEVRIFYLADEDEETDTEENNEPQYDEFGNLIENTDSDTETDTDTQSDTDAPVKEKVIKELDIYSEMYSICYNAIEEAQSSWDTVYMEIKEGETGKVRVTILSDDYKSPTFVYESSDENVATVDNQGNVKSVKPGTCNIIVTSPLNSDAMAIVKIKVKDDTDLLDDYLEQIPRVNQTNDAVIPTETLVAQKIVDIDDDGVSELLLKFDYGNNVETINMVKIENDQCVVYKTYKNISDLYDYYEGNGSYTNSILIHYTTGKVCMEYKAVVAKEGSKTKTSEQKIMSVEDSGSLSELVKFSTTTDITTKTVTSEVVIDPDSDVSILDSDYIDTDSDEYWYGSDDETDSYDDSDDIDDTDYYGDDPDNGYYGSYRTFSFDEDTDTDIVGTAALDMSKKRIAKTLPQLSGEPGDGDDDENGDDDNSDYDEPSRVTSTVTSEVTEEETKYFVNGTPVERSVYDETLTTYSSRYAVWSDWDYL